MEEWLEVVLRRWERDLSVASVRAVRTEPGAPSGCNYSSELLRLSADCCLRSGRSRTLSFVLKRLPPGRQQRLYIDSHRLFHVEIEIYEEVLSKMAPLMRKSDFGEEFWPTLYATQGQELILLEDLKCSGYKTVSGRELTEGELQLAVTALARFHGMSRRLVLDQDFRPERFRRNNMAESDSIVDFVFLSSLRALQAALANMEDVVAPTAGEVGSLLERVGPALGALPADTRGHYDVLNHGDCWANNLLFKAACGANGSTHLKMIDFQMCHFNSYAWDLVQLIYCTLHPGTRERLWDGLLAAYQRTLADTLSALGAGPAPRPADVAAACDRLRLSGLLYSVATQPRLLPGPLDLDLEITDSLAATDKRTALYSCPRVLALVLPDLLRLCNLRI